MEKQTESWRERQLEAGRDVMVTAMPALVQEFIDVCRATGTPAAYQKLMETALKFVPDMKVADKADPYANLPVINYTVQIDGSTNTTVQVLKAETAPVLPLVQEVASTPFTPTDVLEDVLDVLDENLPASLTLTAQPL